MYESPITQILGKIQVTYENECLKAVQSYGFDVNKEELTKALQYDRGQYTKGYIEGYNKAVDDFVEAMKKKYPIAECGFGLMNDRLHENIDELVQELKAR